MTRRGPAAFRGWTVGTVHARYSTNFGPWRVGTLIVRSWSGYDVHMGDFPNSREYDLFTLFFFGLHVAQVHHVALIGTMSKFSATIASSLETLTFSTIAFAQSFTTRRSGSSRVVSSVPKVRPIEGSSTRCGNTGGSTPFAVGRIAALRPTCRSLLCPLRGSLVRSVHIPNSTYTGSSC